MFIEDRIVMGIHEDNPPLMNTKKIKIEDARVFWKNFINEGRQKTNTKW